MIPADWIPVLVVVGVLVAGIAVACVLDQVKMSRLLRRMSELPNPRAYPMEITVGDLVVHVRLHPSVEGAVIYEIPGAAAVEWPNGTVEVLEAVPA